ncbi:MAG TPA: outer membrane protein transport protein [Oleiagrimonas sp.]|nr:outer membrane protein transport protein [Oleiagrimonas sp.]
MSRALSSRIVRPLALTVLAAAVVGSLAVPGTARASAFQLHEDSVQAMGRAYAGMLTAGGDCSVVANSPASMSLLTGGCFQADVTGINFSAKFTGQAHDALGRPISGGNGGDAGTTIPVPALYWATKMGDKWHLGVGFTVPFGFQTKYDRDWMGRYNAVKSKFQSLDATVSLSYDVTDNFSLGLSAIAQRTSAELTSAINYNAVGMGLVQKGVAAGLIPAAQAPALLQQFGTVVPPGSDGMARIKGDDWAYGWQIGGLWRLTDNDRLAINYRSKIEHTISGTANFTMPANVKALLSTPTVQGLLAASGGVPFQHTTGTAGFTTPAVADVSYWHETQNFGIGLELAWTKWDVFKELRVDYGNPVQPPTVEEFNWRNTWYAAVGGDWYVNDRLTLRAGISVDTTPTHVSTRDPRVPDSTRKIAAVGVGYQFSDHLRLDASYAHIFVGSAHVSKATSSTGDTISGSYEDYGNLLGVAVQYTY